MAYCTLIHTMIDFDPRSAADAEKTASSWSKVSSRSALVLGAALRLQRTATTGPTTVAVMTWKTLKLGWQLHEKIKLSHAGNGSHLMHHAVTGRH